MADCRQQHREALQRLAVAGLSREQALSQMPRAALRRLDFTPASASPSPMPHTTQAHIRYSREFACNLKLRRLAELRHPPLQAGTGNG
jgi:hypothetical protein